MKPSIKTLVATLAAALTLVSSAAYAREIVRVGTEPSFAPFEFMPEGSSELTGFDIDLIRAIAKASDFDIALTTMPFDGLIPAILTGSLDVGISAFTITEERKKKVLFSEPYCQAGLGTLINAEYKDQIKSVKDLEGKTLCGQIGTSGAMYEATIKDANVVQFNSASETYLELDKGGCVAVINDRPVHEYYLATTHDEKALLLPDYVSAEEYGIVMSRDNEQVAKLINEGFAKIKQDGTFAAIYEKWFGKKN
ncbi:MAG: basic amino acid ABC transporter substrate-binding protein [Succinivibrio sp.]|nr:basic amino acid ABC transporter substrate-binding protein [Succinivibrio sp.]